jgi:tetratricopeptide (TPR) repeat protein
MVSRPPLPDLCGSDAEVSRALGNAVLRVLLSLIALVCSIASAQTMNVEEILKRAISLHQSGDIAAAIPAYEKYLAQRPDSPLALSNLGAAYAGAGRYKDAIIQYRRALKLQPGNRTAELNLGLAYYKTGQMETAASIFEKIHLSAPGQQQPALLLADCWLAMGKNKKVDALLTPLLEGSPDDLSIAYMLGTALVRDGQIARGQVIIDRILREGDSAEARLLLGVTKLNAHDYPAAREDLAKAVELKPSLPDVYSYLGQALQATGDPAAAMDAYRKAVAANPNSFIANLELGVLLKGEQKLEEALICLRRALETRPGDFDARHQIAAIDLQQGRVDAARLKLEDLVREAPAFTAAHVTLATVYYRLKRKADGDRQRAIVQKLTAETQAKQQQGVNVK